MSNNLIASVMSMRFRLSAVLAEKFGDQFDGDMDTLDEVIAELKKIPAPPTK
ncbi:hypothetical protein BRC2024_HCTLARHO_CDS_0043 [Acinetobacter phage vB_AbaS_Silvergun]